MDRQTAINVSVNIRRILKEKNITQEKLATKCGLSKGTISNYVNCKLGNEGPTDYALDLIGTALGVSREALLAEVKDPIVAETTAALKQAHAQNEELETKLEDKETKLSELTKQIKSMQDESTQDVAEKNNQHPQDTFTFMRRCIKVLAIALAIAIVLLIIVTFYAGFAFFAFDLLDPTQGLYRG